MADLDAANGRPGLRRMGLTLDLDNAPTSRAIAMADLDFVPDGSPPATLTALLRGHAERRPNRVGFGFLADGVNLKDEMTYAALDRSASRVAGLLRADSVRGEPVLLLYAPSLEYVSAFFGCLYAGAIAVPAYPPHRNRSVDRLVAIVRDSGARVVLCSAAVRDSIERVVADAPELRSLHWIATDEAAANADPFVDESSTPETLAFLQYTSGSTSTPKGVMLSHGNLFHNARCITEGFHLGDQSQSVFWLPLYHDMGLIGGVLQPMQVGRPSFLMAPATFLSQPVRWLQAISKYRATISGAPNFAYDLCTNKVTDEQLADLDLSCWLVAFNGAEPVRADTLERFAARFAPCGFRATASYPCYGLAESTLIVTGGNHDHAPVTMTVSRTGLEQHRIETVPADHEDGRTLVGCGEALLDQRVVIVDPDTFVPCPPDRPGEIWISGPSVAQGYWKKPELSAETFAARTADGDGPYLRTGDLGFVHGGELFITGRIKDLVILRGRNHYPQDIEQTVEASHPAIRPACCAAFAVDDADGERLVIVAEVERSERKADVSDVAQAARRAVAEHHDVQIDSFVLLKPGSVPKTSSGKIQRHACKTGYLDGSLSELGRWDAAASTDAAADAALDATAASMADIRSWLIDRIAAKLRLSRTAIDPRQPLSQLGLDSLSAVQLAGELEEFLKTPLSPVLIYDHPTIDALARHLAGDERTESVGRGPLSVASRETNAGDFGHGPRTTGEIAIVGIGCRFPQADGPKQFWELLRRGGDAISEIPAERWNADEYYSSDPSAAGKMTTRFGGFLSNVDRFDRGFFGISPREAERMDPQQRLLLEVTWEAFEDAGQDVDRLAGKSVGVFVGIASNDYARLQLGDPATLDAYVGTGNALSIAANRLSYTFDFHGPSMAVDTACSSSLVAVHLACQSLRRGESRLAVAAGVNLILTPDLTINFSRANMMAPDGRCKAFDASADGYVRSEGVGVVILKPLAQAKADGDRVYAVIRGSAINQDGRSNGLTAPNRQSQESVLRAAYADARVCPGEVDAIEAHGTGTSLGDPIEALALGHVLSEGRPADRPAWLGSVKTNIGHTEAAAGIAGLIKMALALHHGELPASLHFENPNPHIPFDALPLRMATEWQSLYERVRPAIVGVSSFGFGGTNAHVVLQGVEPICPVPQLDLSSQLIPLSARSPMALSALAERWLEAFDTGRLSISDLAYTAAQRRTLHDHRLAIVARDAAGLRDCLKAYLANEPRAGLVSGVALPNREPRVAFVFSGQGSQWWGMGRDLLDREPDFLDAVTQCDAIFRPIAGWSLIEVLRSENNSERLDETLCVQPVVFALQVGLAELWRSWGVTPAAVVGHSLGEVAAAYVSGAISLADAVRIVWHRARLQHEARGQGRMAAVGLSADESRAAINGLHDFVSVAAINGPNSTVWSGDPESLEKALRGVRQRDVFHRMLRGQVAFHSPQMESAAAQIVRSLNGMAGRPTQVPFVSTVTGREEAGESLTTAYWARNLREPVQFAAAIETLLADGVDAFLEIGPHPVLAEPLQQLATHAPSKPLVLSSLRRDQESRATLLASLGALWSIGVDCDWNRITPTGRYNEAPTYPWHGERCWFEVPKVQRTTSPLAPVRESKSYDHWIVRPEWRRIELPEPIHSLAGTWLVVGAQSGTLQRTKRELTARGSAVITVCLAGAFERMGSAEFALNPSDVEQWRRLIREATPAGADLHGIVYLDTAAPPTDGLTINSLNLAQERGSIGLLHLIQGLVHHGATPRLWIVTRGTQCVRNGESSAVAAAPIWGFGRVLTREHPELRPTLVDLDPTPRPDDFSSLIQLLAADIEDDQWARREDRWLAARLVPGAEKLAAMPTAIRSDATYLLTGGLGGLGVETARWLIERGARTLVLTSRRGETPEMAATLADLRSAGATVIIAKGDAADADQLDAILGDIDDRLPPLRGVMHLAGVLDDGITLHQDRARMWKVLSPKLLGAWNLHVRTASRQLDFFALFSSIASIIGSPGQSNYAAGNAFLDALAQHRRSRNLSAVSINWGPWSQVGMAARDGQPSRLAATGLQSIEPATGLDILGHALESNAAQIGVLPIEPSSWNRFAPGGQAPPYMAELAKAAESPATAAPVPVVSSLDRSALLAAHPDDWQSILESQLRDQTSRVLKMSPAALDIEQPLSNLGIDSLMAIELKNRIEADLGATVPMVKFLEGPSVRELSAFLAEQLVPLLTPTRRLRNSDGGSRIDDAISANRHPQSEIPTASANGSDAVDAGQLLSQLDDLSDSEVDSLLSELCDAEKGD
jgi:acyl transferase domain-containing protein/acyl-CoA synthetase (AMP-forming)/AMP-acid ligase II/acyl carrier protein